MKYVKSARLVHPEAAPEKFEKRDVYAMSDAFFKLTDALMRVIDIIIKQEIEQFSSELEISEVGQVVEVGDGIARVYGLSKVMAGELLEFEGEQGSAGMETIRHDDDACPLALP